MSTAPQIRIKAWPMINNISSVFPYLFVAIMSIIYISPAIALSINPTNRYMKEMGRLLRDHRQLNVVASPEKEAPTLPYDVVDEEDSEDLQYTDNRNIPNNNSREKEMMEQAWGEQQFRQEIQYEIEQMPTSLDEPSSFGPAFSVFNDNQPSNQAEQMLRFDTPRPPSDLPPPPQDNAAFYEQAALKLESDEPIHNGFNQVPKRDTDLFQAFNEHIEALGQQIQETFTIKQNVIDEEYQQPVESELEYVDDIQGGYIQLDEGYSSNENSKVKSMEATDNTFYAESVRGDFAFDATESVSSLEKTSFDATEQFQTQQYPPVQENNFDEQRALKQELERLESERRAAEEIATRAVERFKAERSAAEVAKQELERLEAEKRAAEEESAKREMQERQRENERQEQERIAATQAKDELTEKLRQEKEDLEKELARQIAEQYRRLIESRDKEPTAIAKSKLVPRLPKTNDPLELLGLDYRNPPESANELRRAFLKMAKKYHPDAVAADATQDERDIASLNFARINSAYQLLKEKQEWLGDEYFATMLGGPMYQPRNSRNSHIRQPFSRGGFGFDDYSSSFSSGYSATYGARQPRPQTGNSRTYYEEDRSFFRRTQRQEVRDSCHVGGGRDFPPFFNN